MDKQAQTEIRVKITVSRNSGHRNVEEAEIKLERVGSVFLLLNKNPAAMCYNYIYLGCVPTLNCVSYLDKVGL